VSGLEVRDLKVRIGGKVLVREASFSAPAAQITGLVGPNGAGKSTLMRALLGLTEGGGGKVQFADADLLAMRRRDRARMCAFVEQSASTEIRMTVEEVVSLGRLPFQPAWQAAPDRGDAAAIGAALAAIGMSGFADRLFSTLSGGEQQRVHLARALAQEPRLLVLDEPTSHLDVRGQHEMLGLLRDRSSAGLTVLMAIHDLNLAAAYCDWLVVMRAGAVVAQGAPEALLSPPLLQDVYDVETTVMQHPKTGKPLIAFGG
jgi:iron complex transport system ATP-binding protein